MRNMKLRIPNLKGKISFNDLLLWCFAFWPLFWNLWAILKYPGGVLGYSTSIYILWGIAFLVAVTNRTVRNSGLYFWLLFLIIVAVEMILKQTFSAINNISVILCGFLICAFSTDRKFNYRFVLKCVYSCGLFVSITLLVEYVTKFFQTNLLHVIYNEGTVATILRLGGTGGGILPYNASAACFIFGGCFAYIALAKLENNTKFKSSNWFVIAFFFACMVLLRKRGHIIDMIGAAIIMWLIGIRKQDLHSVSLRKQAKLIGTGILLTVIALVVYKTIPAITGSIDDIIAKFYKEDITSGRTGLYTLAIQLFKSNVLTGIGWGRYRTYTVGFFGNPTVSYATHNIYLQLLCETGIIGFCTFVITVLTTLFYGIKKYRKLKNQGTSGSPIEVIGFGIFVQLFFILYGFTGNPLYDFNYLSMYFIGILFTTVPDNESR